MSRDEHIAALEAECAKLRAENEQLRAILEESETNQYAAPPSAVPHILEREPSVRHNSPTAHKLALFRSLFSGRTDVYPARWQSPKTGRSGYSPACSNEWVSGICEKPRIKCAECPNRAFLAVTDEAVYDHLAGRQTLGVYPLLKDDTTWFVAADTLILDDIRAAIADGRTPLVLTERKDHLLRLSQALKALAVADVIVLSGGMGRRKQASEVARLGMPSDTDRRIVLATGRFIGEGFDDPRLDTLFLAMPIAWRGTLAQYAGRLHRDHAGKREVRIYDYVDADVPPLARMFNKRLRGYRAMGYAILDDARGPTAPTLSLEDAAIA